MRRLLLVAAVLLAGTSTRAQAGAGSGRDGASEHDRIVGYWTPARWASAVLRSVSPRPMASRVGVAAAPRR